MWRCGLVVLGLFIGQVQAAPDVLLTKELPAHVTVSDYLISEKYDGVRAYWDGAQLWFRGGGTIAAPAWFTAVLPKQALDGELWGGRGQFEQTASAVRQTVPNDAAWRQIRYMIFELPNGAGDFAQRAAQIEHIVAQMNQPHVQAVKQYHLASREQLQKNLDQVVAQGGEGLMLHLASAPYVTGRSDVLYKLKPLQDAEATVIAHLAGQGKYHNMLGALLVRTDDGREFKIGTGFSDEVRRQPPAIGTVVTYRYRGLTRNGLPRFASYWRVR
ncbi:MAG: DNA ligase [Formosimonas sp.]